MKQLAAIRTLGAANQPSAVEIITKILAIIGDLDSTSLNTMTARADADRLLVYWQSRTVNY